MAGRLVTTRKVELPLRHQCALRPISSVWLRVTGGKWQRATSGQACCWENVHEKIAAAGVIFEAPHRSKISDAIAPRGLTAAGPASDAAAVLEHLGGVPDVEALAELRYQHAVLPAVGSIHRHLLPGAVLAQHSCSRRRRSHHHSDSNEPVPGLLLPPCSGTRRTRPRRS
jgi:hypothetical protein